MFLNTLGRTGIKVSPLCFGTLSVGPLQKNYPPEDAAYLFRAAFEAGVNFFDTAEIYQTYESLRSALKYCPEMVIASKSYAVTAARMEKSVETARKALDRDYIDIFCLHEVESDATLRGHRGALDYLQTAKAKGLIRAVGISTHTIAGARAGACEPGIDVIHPLLNMDGIGIKDGSATAMVEAIKTAQEFGKGVYAMKALAGGHLIAKAAAAIAFITNLDCIDSIAIGMQSLDEVKLNLQLIGAGCVPPELFDRVKLTPRSLRVASWCRGCGLCVAQCGFGALSLEKGHVKVEEAKCMRCGYCARVCPDFCLKIV